MSIRASNRSHHPESQVTQPTPQPAPTSLASSPMTKPKPWILCTPASRGIGFELARRLLLTTSLPIIATARTDLSATKSRLLSGLDVDPFRLEVLRLDVTDEPSIVAAALRCQDRFKDGYLRLAFCVPGILYPERSPDKIEYDKAIEMFKVNTLGPLMLMKHFSPFLPRKSTVVEHVRGMSAQAVFAFMAARVGSISDNRKGGWYTYRASKTAVMQTAKGLDVWLEGRAGQKAMSVALHPGTVRTGLSEGLTAGIPEEKIFEAEWAAERMCEVVRGLGTEGRGRVWDWEGKEIVP